jgi:DNA end-binding protein Ku
MKMAEQLVAEMSAEWDPKKYKDEYRNDLLALIRKRVKEGKAQVLDESEPEAPARQREAPDDMMELLRRSLEQGNGKRAQAPRAANKNASRKGGKRAAASSKKTAVKRAA